VILPRFGARQAPTVASMTRYLSLLLGVALVLGTAACGTPARNRRVPSVSGERLDLAEDTLDATGLDYRVIGGGAFGIVVRSNWIVCRQTPSANSWSKSVTLYVDRPYDDD
jgi:hypothetical protein